MESPDLEHGPPAYSKLPPQSPPPSKSTSKSAEVDSDDTPPSEHNRQNSRPEPLLRHHRRRYEARSRKRAHSHQPTSPSGFSLIDCIRINLMVLVVVVFATVNTLLLACDPQHVDFCLLNVALAGSSALVLFLVLLYGLAAGLFARHVRRLQNLPSAHDSSRYARL